MRDTRGQHARLAGSGAGQHQHRSVERLDSLTLFRIEPGQIARRARRRGPRARGNAAGRRRRRLNGIESLSQRIGQGQCTERNVSAILTGQIDQVLTMDPRGTRYVVIGNATDQATPVGVVVRFVEHDQLLIITVYEIG